MDKPYIPRDNISTQLLDGKSYPLWNIMMEVELPAKGLCKTCDSVLAPNADATTINNWNQINGEAVHLILSRIHPTLLVSLVDNLTSKNAKALLNNINNKFTSHTVVNRGRTRLHWECLRFNGNFEEFIN
ncbi:hypothetical protein O181_073721 [Austropuccinia psidii MF-1]|uniref:Uncharacterized protein n=1 Tax=Austropuccinia psidii MF-1 TaxID=1389203 RepID=A0A9Q3FBN7_9BASI|nr:hypothetical protein [Austropuccinia psidii MF-1]